MSDDYERYGNNLNLTPEQARNRRERRNLAAARTQRNQLAAENARLRAATTDEPGLRAALVDGMAYALTRAQKPDPFDTARDYAERLAPLVIESGYLTPAASARHDAESPVGSLDVEQLARAMRPIFDGPNSVAIETLPWWAARDDDGDLIALSLDQVAARIAAEYARLTDASVGRDE